MVKRTCRAFIFSCELGVGVCCVCCVCVWRGGGKEEGGGGREKGGDSVKTCWVWEVLVRELCGNVGRVQVSWRVNVCDLKVFASGSGLNVSGVLASVGRQCRCC